MGQTFRKRRFYRGYAGEHHDNIATGRHHISASLLLRYPDPDSPYLTVSPIIVDVKYQNADRAGLAIDYSTPHIRFMAKQDGYYNATVQQKDMWSTEPPDYITFLEEVTPNREIYLLWQRQAEYFAPVGGIVFIVGLFKNRNVKRKSRK